jgi:hypothetical protein
MDQGEASVTSEAVPTARERPEVHTGQSLAVSAPLGLIRGSTTATGRRPWQLATKLGLKRTRSTRI